GTERIVIEERTGKAYYSGDHYETFVPMNQQMRNNARRSMPTAAQLRSVKPPWVHLVVLDPGRKPESALAVPSEFAVRTIDGRRASTKRGLLAEFARVFEFPRDSGRNWDALEELLADLEWLPAEGYLLILTHADELLGDDTEDYETFIEIMKDVAKEWA